MSTSDSNCKDGSSTKSKEGVCDVNDKLQNMSIGAAVSICANCGKEDANNVCAKCKQVRYCNAVCKKVHKKKHKKDCEELIRLATEKRNEELKRAAEKHDEKLFKEPPSQYGDCPICFERLPTLEEGRRYKTCCGKVICSGCSYAPVYDNQGNEVDNEKQNECAFCRVVAPKSSEEMIKRMMKRAEMNDPIAIHNLGNYYDKGRNGYPQNYKKALELWHRAAELGHSKADSSIGYAYETGRGVEVDMKKAKYYYELAAIGGNAQARFNLGLDEARAGNFDRALKHFMISVRSGNADSLRCIQKLYSDGDATKEDYTTALRSYQEYLGEIKSAQRDTAAQSDERYRYYESGA